MDMHCMHLTYLQTDDQKFDQLRTGSVRLQLKFADYLPVPVTLIIYEEYQNMIEVDKN